MDLTAADVANMPLAERCHRIREIDVVLIALHARQRALYHEGITIDQTNRLHSMVMRDGLSHYG